MSDILHKTTVLVLNRGIGTGETLTAADITTAQRDAARIAGAVLADLDRGQKRALLLGHPVLQQLAARLAHIVKQCEALGLSDWAVVPTDILRPPHERKAAS